jgi:nuclease S1
MMGGLALVLGAPHRALAWGKIGHRAASVLAERHLSPAAAAVVRQLLEPGETLADASLWADEHRREVAGSGAWHYVDVPITEARYAPRFCPDSGCVVSKIAVMQQILASKSASQPERREALRFLVHLVQDLHQPLHVGGRGDRGGNDLQVRFFDHGSNLHRVWDDGLIEHHSTDEAAWVADLEQLASPEQRRRWCAGTLEDYATESLQAAQRAYTRTDGPSLLESGAELGRAYFERELPVVRRRLAQAGVRLSCILNALFMR